MPTPTPTIPAVWLSRHAPTFPQILEINRLGYTLEGVPDGQVLGALDLRDNGDVRALVTGVLGLVVTHKARAIFGVFAAPIAAQIWRTARDSISRGSLSPLDGRENGDVPCFASWNVQRSEEGGKSTFSHREWVLVGHLNQASTRFLG